jgi:calcineurin-like phosphoesterase family protein
LEWIARRPGEKHLVPGNHDGIHPSSRDSHKWFPEYLQVFSSVQPFVRRKIAGQSVLLSHFPYEGEGQREGGDRFTQYRLRDEGLPVLHGHVHDDEKQTETGWGTTQLHVGLDAWNLAPVHLDELAELLG